MFNGVFSGKTVLITGNTGFKGSWLTLWLLKLGAKVVGVSKDVPTDPSLFESLNLASRISHVFDDIRNAEGMARLVRQHQPHFLFHLAAQPIVSQSFREPLETITTNVVGTANILEALRSAQHPCVAVIITSDKCYDNVEWQWGYRETDALGGKDIYSGSKGAAELVFRSYFYSFLKNSSVAAATARAGNVIGGGDWAKDRIVPDAMRSWSSGSSVTIRSPKATRPWQHVLEPLSGYLSLAQQLQERPGALSGESFNFGPKAEQNHTVETIIRDMSRQWKFADPSAAYGVTPNAEFKESGLLKLNCDKALAGLSWQPTLEYSVMIDFVSAWYYHFYRSDRNMFDFTMEQIDAYQSLAQKKDLPWTR